MIASVSTFSGSRGATSPVWTVNFSMAAGREANGNYRTTWCFFYAPPATASRLSPPARPLLRGLLRRRPLFRLLLHRKRLQHAHAVAFGVHEGDVGADSRDVDRFAEHLAARARDLRHALLDVLHRDHDRGMLLRPVRLLRKEAAVDPGRLPRGAVRRAFRRRGKDVVAHRPAQLLVFPSERRGVELRHAVGIVLGHLDMN